MLPLVNQRQEKQRTIKAFDTDIVLINNRAKELGYSAADVIHVMCEELRKEVYLKEFGEAFDSLHTNPNQLAEFEAEQKAWDSTLSDGLNDAD